MLQSIQVTNINKAVKKLSLFDYIDGLIISNVDGVDPVDAEIIDSKYAGQDGTEYQTATRGKRTLLLTLDVDVFTEAGSAQQIRQRLMRFFMPKSPVDLEFERLGAPHVVISGYVESFDFPLMVEEPQVTLSIVCTKPDFIDPTPKDFSSRSNTAGALSVLDYEGTVETGFLFRMQMNRSVPNLVLKNTAQAGITQQMDVDFDFLNGDIFEVSTVSRQKRATLIRNGVSQSILYAISPYSDWVNVFPGENTLFVQQDGDGIPYTLEYTDKIGGL